MLLKSLDHVFWLGRYLERLDDTARLINATSQLLIDSHKDSQVSWPLLIDVLGEDSQQLLAAAARDEGLTTEQQVMQLLLTRAESPLSLRSVSTALKTNARTIRPLLPRDMWEELNALDLFIQAECASLPSRQQRYRLMSEITRRCQMVVGVLDGTMLRSDAFDAFNLGRHLERADMTTRIMDVMVLQQLQPTDIKRPRFRWLSVLNALGGVESYQYYQAQHGGDADAVDYLLGYADFPRSIRYCLNRVAASAKAMPHSTAILQQVWLLQDLIQTEQLGELSTAQLHQLIDHIQSGLILLHQVILAAGSLEHAHNLDQLTA